MAHVTGPSDRTFLDSSLTCFAQRLFQTLLLLIHSYVPEKRIRLNLVAMGSVMLQHLPSAWHVDQAIVSFLHA